MHKLFPLRAGLGLLLALASAPVYANVQLPALFGDHMVIQRGQPVHVWGDAAPGESVTVSFRGAERTSAADELGRWSVQLPPGSAGGPFVLTVRGANTLTLRDVLVGDVWLASGQSNMEYPVKGFPSSTPADAQQTIAAAHAPEVRLLNVQQRAASYPRTDLVVSEPWSVCAPETVANFSAVAYFFARQLELHEHVPIGVIESTWGGTPAEAWTSMDTLGGDAALMPVFAAWSAILDEHDTVLRAHEKDLREAAASASAGKQPAHSWHPRLETWAPSALYNGMIAPLTPFPIRGVIWYQGESSTDPRRAPVYGRLFPALIRSWRAAWHQDNLPFLFVQIANYQAGPGAQWPEVREAQADALSLANTGMAVTIDIGNPHNIHPTDKQDVGLRLALLARALVYGETIEDSGPVYRTLSREGGALRLYFDHAGTGLVAKGTALTGFEVAGADGYFVPATAVIEGTTVVVSSPAVSAPTQARYGWADAPQCNLYNPAGLPASPFRTTRPTR